MSIKTIATVSLLASITLTSVRAEVDFTTQIGPIFEKRCIECHGPDKQKGKLRLDSAADAFKGETVIVKGKPDESELIHRIGLPEGDDDIMPPKGDPLSKAEQELIKEWIAAGAAWPESLVLGAQKPVSADKEVIEWPADHKADAAEVAAVKKLNDLGISVRPIAQNSPWMTANLRVYSGEFTDELVASLGKVVGLVDLNLANTAITDAQLAKLAGLKNLMTLHLENTAITDAGLRYLADMAFLNYLNLYGTKVSDAGLKQLDDLKRLKKLYAWQTAVTPEGAAKLKESVPLVAVNLGESLVVAEDKKEEAKPSDESGKKDQAESGDKKKD